MLRGVRQRIRDNSEDIIKDVIRFCSQPSISVQGIGMHSMASLLVDSLEALNAKVEMIQFPNGNPVIFGEIPGDTDKTLLFYNHYDVQPPDPLNEWVTPPFEPCIRDGKLYGRGTSDNKGDIVSRLHAIKAILEERGTLPITIKFLIEGEEEIGSVHLGEAVEQLADRLRVDGCIWETGARSSDERIEIALGCKGIAYMEVEAVTAKQDLHSSNATIVLNPIWRLIWALSSLKDQDEFIAVDGFYDDIRVLTPEEQEVLNDLKVDEVKLKESLGTEEFLLGLTGIELMKRHILSPTCTICGFTSGYTGEGAKTVLPNRAKAKVDFRLVPDQEPYDIMRKVEDHLEKYGFSDIKVTWSHSVPAYRARLDSSIVKIARSACEDIYEERPLILLSMAGTGPMYQLSGKLDVPTVSLGVGYAGSAMHGPNENIRIEDLILGTEAMAILISKFAEAGSL